MTCKGERDDDVIGGAEEGSPWKSAKNVAKWVGDGKTEAEPHSCEARCCHPIARNAPQPHDYATLCPNIEPSASGLRVDGAASSRQHNPTEPTEALPRDKGLPMIGDRRQKHFVSNGWAESGFDIRSTRIKFRDSGDNKTSSLTFCVVIIDAWPDFNCVIPFSLLRPHDRLLDTVGSLYSQLYSALIRRP